LSGSHTSAITRKCHEGWLEVAINDHRSFVVTTTNYVKPTRLQAYANLSFSAQTGRSTPVAPSGSSPSSKVPCGDHSASPDQIVGRVHVLSSQTFGEQAPNFLLREVNCSPGIAKRSEFFVVSRNFMRDGDDRGPCVFSRTPNHVESFVLRHASL
jgi:hypothetical protein